jgi:hypothetical protein
MKLSYVSFFGDVLKFFWKRMVENIFRAICHFKGQIADAELLWCPEFS